MHHRNQILTLMPRPVIRPVIRPIPLGLIPPKKICCATPVIAKQHILISAIWGQNTPHSLEIAVTDKGSGVTSTALNPVVQNMLDPNAPSGRGLALIQKLGVDIKIEQSLREVRLIFA